MSREDSTHGAVCASDTGASQFRGAGLSCIVSVHSSKTEGHPCREPARRGCACVVRSACVFDALEHDQGEGAPGSHGAVCASAPHASHYHGAGLSCIVSVHSSETERHPCRKPARRGCACPAPCSLYRAPCTLHPAPCTLHPAPRSCAARAHAPCYLPSACGRVKPCSFASLSSVGGGFAGG